LGRFISKISENVSGRFWYISTVPEPGTLPASAPHESPPEEGREAAGSAQRPAPATPMLRQYAEAKAQAKDALLFFRLGDFYELFYDDARIAAQALGIALTARSKGDDRVPMAGVPYHAARSYIGKLVALGHKVAVCDQLEAPGPGKALVRREIVRLVTPGTLVDDDGLDGREPLLLAALAPERPSARAAEDPAGDRAGPRAALAFLDASTGELRALPPLAWEAALDELARARPREVLLPEELLGTPLADAVRRSSGAVRLEGRSQPDPAEAERRLRRHLGLGTLDGFGFAGEPLCAQAAADALSYLQETQRSAAQHVVRVSVERPAEALWIDPSAVRNLELFRGPDGRRTGTLLALLDRTHTAAGGRMLARWLAAPLLDLVRIRGRQDAVEELAQAAVLREDLSGALRGVLDIERLLGRLAIGQGAPRDLAGLRASLVAMPALAARLASCKSGDLKRLAPQVDGLGALTSLLSRALADEVPAGREPGFIRPGYRAALDELTELAHGGRAAIAALEAQEKARTGINSLKVRYNRVSGFYIEVTKANLHLVPADYQRRSSTVGAERFATAALAEHESRVLSAEERRSALEQEIFEELKAAVLTESGPLRACAEAAAQADVLLSLARVAADGGWVRPTVDDSELIEIAGGRHPVVERALAQSGEGPFVPNDLALDADRRLVVLTGPNMAGKSTAMRQVALIALLAQAGSFVPAQRARIGLVDRLFTRVGAADDLARGQSTFMVEMAECARILHQATPRSLLLLDEVGRGTSTFDGLAIAWAVAEHLHDRAARTLFATHYHELCDLAREKPRAVNLTMAVTEVEGRVVFLRKVVPGAASRSYGIHVAKLAGLPEAVLVRAREILANLEAQELDEAGRPLLAVGEAGAAPARKARRAQLGLFAPATPEVSSPPASDAPPQASPVPRPDPALSALAESLRALDLSRTTPLEALLFLNEAQKRFK
jgi:DNA mismatch repair protein MutS